MNKFILLAPFLLLLLTGIASASPTSVPSGITHYVPVNLTNSQTAATPAPFQQMVSINESTYSSYINYNSNFANFEYFYANGTVIPSWIESNSSGKLITWVKIAGGIPASSKLTVYLGFANKTTNLLSSSGTSGVGEAPQLSSTYAKYDDGASVFIDYWNFAGTSLPSGWTNMGSAANPTVDNGVTLAVLTADTGNQGWYDANYQIPVNSVIEALYSDTGSGTVRGSEIGIGDSIFGGSGTRVEDYEVTPAAGSTWGPYGMEGYGTGNETSVGYTSGTMIMLSGAYYSTGATIYSNYQPILSESGTATTTDAYPNFGVFQDALFIQYMRVRAYPPNGVMPSVTFGAVVKVSSVTLSISTNPATYGQSIKITATCLPDTNACAIDYPALGTTLATGTGTATYTYSPYALAAGTYSSFYGYDPTSGTNSTPLTLTVSKASVSPSCEYAGVAMTNDTTQETLNTMGYLNCTLPSHGSQLTGSLQYNSSIVGSGASVSYLTKFDNKNNSFTFSTAGNTNYTAGSFVGHIYYPLYELIAVSNLGSSAYETGTVNPQYTFNITKAANNATFTLNVNGINVSNTIQNVNAGTNLYSPEYQIPLQEVNGTVYTFNGILTVKGSFGSITEQADSSTQKELWNYYPVISVSPNPNIVGDNVSLNTAITQKVNLDLANVSGDVLLGNKTISERVNSLYNYTALLLSFIPSRYNLTMPSGTLPATYNWKSVIKLSFGSQNLYRNATSSAPPQGNTAINTYYPALTACPTGTPSINWDFYNASSPSKQITASVLMSGFFTLINNQFNYQINGTDAGWTPTATASSYETCIYPSFAKFAFNSTISASSANTAVSQAYYQDFMVSNVSTTQKFYLLQITDPIAYEVFVENLSTQTYLPALVKVLLYNQNTNSSIQITELKTGYNSGTALTLQNNDTFKLIAYSLNGKQEIGSTNFFTVSGSCSSGVCDEVVPIGTANVTLPQTILHNLQHSCILTNNNKTNTSIVSCTYSSVNGASYNVSLYVNKTSAIYTLVNDNVCTQSSDAASGSLTCIVNQTNSTQYLYTLSLQYDNKAYPLNQGLVGTQQSSYGPNGYFLMVLILATVALAFVTRNANVVVIAFTAGWVGGSFVGLAYAPALSDGFLFITAAFILYLINRK